MADEEPKPPQPPVPTTLPMKKLFVSEMDTLLGERIVERFGKTTEFEIVGTRRADPVRSGVPDIDAEDLPPMEPSELAAAQAAYQPPLPKYVARICPCYEADPAEFKRSVLDADVIICPLRDSTVEAAAAIRMLANIPFDVEKTFILVSSTLTWANTYNAQKAQVAAEREAERQAMIEAGEEPPEEEDDAAAPQEEEEAPTFTEDMYHQRIPHRRYQHWKDVEHAVKASNSETLHTYVFFSGLTYGRGEDMLEPLFKAAWHREPLPMLTNGGNSVPMIHIDDLATAVFRAGSQSDVMPQRYIMAVDRGCQSGVTWGQAVKAIGDALGTGQTYPEPRATGVQWSDWMTVDIKADAASLNDLIEESEWASPDGFVAGIERTVQEYKECRGLTPVRALVVGPPHCGKSYLAKRIATQYRINHLTVGDITEGYEKHRKESAEALAAYRRMRAEEKKAAAREEKRRAAAEAAAEEAAAKAEADGGNGGDDNEAGEDGDDVGGDRRKGGGGVSPDGDDDDGRAAEKEFVVEFDEEGPPPGQQQRDGGEGDGDGEDGEGGNNARPTEGGEEGAEGGEEEDAAAAVDPAADDDPDDEVLNKMKEDLAYIDKVLSLRNTRPGGGGRYLDAALAVMCRWTVGTTKRCRNQGYILDGFPKTVRQAALTFAVGEIPLPEPDEEGLLPPDEPSPPPPDADPQELQATLMAAVDDAVLFDTAFVLSGSDHLLAARCSSSSAAAASNHNSLESFYRRLNAYNANNAKSAAASSASSSASSSKKPTHSLEAWLGAILTNKEGTPRALSVHHIDTSNSDHTGNPALAKMQAVLGEPHFIHPTPDEITARREAQEMEAERTRLEQLRLQELQEQKETAIAAAKAKLRANDERRLRSVNEERIAAAAVTKLSTQEYLMKFVLQPVTEGMTHVTEVRPDDPVGALADFLFHYKPNDQL